MFQSLGFVAREFWFGDYGLGDCDEFGGVPYRAPHRSPLSNLSGRVAALTPEEILLAAEESEASEDDSVLGVYEADLEATLSAMESEPTEPDPADAFPRVPHPDLAPDGLLKRKLSRPARMRRDRSWKRNDLLYRRHRRLARRVSASIVEATI